MSIIAKYKFDSNIYADLLPEFNTEFTSDKYNTTDEEVDGIITRTIESDELPTLMRFGRVWVNGESATDNRTDSLLEILDMNTSGLTSCYSMFRYCTNLTSITCEWNTSNVTYMNHMFSNCHKLTSLDVSNFNTTNVTNMYAMFYNCNKLTSLDVSNFDTSNVTNMEYMFSECNKLTSLDVSNFDTNNVTTMVGMFNSCYNLTSLDVSNWNTNKVTNMSHMFSDCNNLTTLDVSNWDTSNVNYMNYMFSYCHNLTTLDVSNFDTSNVTTLRGMFSYAYKLASLDVSNWNTSNVTDMGYTFSNCTKLTSLDISNFDTNNVTDMVGMFNNTPLLTDIGMLYCNQSTINKIASLLPTDITQTIWIEDVDVKDLTPVEGVEFKQYAKNTEIMLTSPLLEGDKLIVKDGKLYHYHKMGMVVLDGSEDWVQASNDNKIYTYRFVLQLDKRGVSQYDTPIYSDTLKIGGAWSDYEHIWINEWDDLNVHLNVDKIKSYDLSEFKQWLQANPTTVVYELATPYYELISEEPLTISLIAESSDIINSSNIPLNMTINNKGLSTIAMSPSTTYTIAFDKDTDSEVVVNLCGNEITTTDNVVEITTPSEIDDELIFYGDGVEVSNVRLLEGSVSGDSIPRESFEGLKNSFEDGYIPENLVTKLGIIPDTSQGNGITILGDNYTFPGRNLAVMFSHSNFSKPHTFVVIPSNDSETQQYTVHSMANGNVQVYQYVRGFNTLLFNQPADRYRMYTEEESANSSFRILILEGDWTHLTEEDFNHLGKYKVEYKVTGKNKFDINLWNDAVFSDGTPLNITNNTITINAENDDIYSITGANGYEIVPTSHRKHLIKVKPNTTYTLSMQCSNNTVVRRNYIFEYDKNYSQQAVYPYGMDNVVLLTSDTMTFTTKKDTVYIGFRIGVWKAGSLTYSNIQLEEGSTVTPYEPYKEYTKTFYLNSPLLEGDTIEDVSGVATHVKRYAKVVLDGSSDENWSFLQIIDELYDYRFNVSTPAAMNRTLPVFCDNLLGLPATKATGDREEGVVVYPHNETYSQGILFTKTYQTVAELKQWLQANPTTVVYRLASPIYEPISTESILCDSYVNGHLDVDTNIPIEKVQFDQTHIYLKYIQPNTTYTLQFESDNIGKIENVFCNNSYGVLNVVKGINRFTFTTPMEIQWNILDLNGIGFNASNIQVVATDRDVDFGYFKGLQSSFEDNNVKILWDGTLVEGVHISTNHTYSETINKARSVCIKCKPNTTYIITATNNDRLRIGHVSELVEGIACMAYDIDDTNIRYKEFTTAHREGYLIVYVANEGNTNENITVDIREKTNEVKCKVIGKNKFDGELEAGAIGSSGVNQDGFSCIRSKNYIEINPSCKYILSNNLGYTPILFTYDANYNYLNEDVDLKNLNPNAKYIRFRTTISTEESDLNVKFQLEEGTQVTEYEPYQEYTKTIYLNSPLLKGDTIEVHNGKLCHYHKMGMVVLDGSEDWKPADDNGILVFYYLQTNVGHNANRLICDKFKTTDTVCVNYGEVHYGGKVNERNGNIVFSYNSSDVNTWKSWLKTNPTTIIYELAEPYYEEITPMQEDLIITSVKEGDLHIDTIVPISSKVTYNVNVQLLTDFEQSIVEQVQATQTTDLQSILDEEIDN